MKVVVGAVHGEDVNGWFYHSMLSLTSWVRRHTDPDTPEFVDIDDYVMVRSGPAMAMGRGQLVGAFLEQTDGDALVMLDADMGFEPQTVVSMAKAFGDLQKLHDNKVGLLGGLAFMSNDPRPAHPRPNLWADNPHQPGLMYAMDTYEPDSLYEVAATGGACVIISRSALETVVKDAEGNGINPFHHVPIVDWVMLARACEGQSIEERARLLRQVVLNADQLGEDLSFCRRLRDAGFKLFLHTGLRFDHAKSCLIGEPEYLNAVERRTEKGAA